MDNFAAAATATAGVVNSARAIRQRDGHPSDLEADDNRGASGNNKSGSKQNNNYKTSNCGSSWRIDSNTYSNYETQLIKMRTYPEKYDNYTADYASFQSKMRQIRTKWEARGCSITKSQYE